MIWTSVQNLPLPLCTWGQANPRRRVNAHWPWQPYSGCGNPGHSWSGNPGRHSGSWPQPGPPVGRWGWACRQDRQCSHARPGYNGSQLNFGAPFLLWPGLFEQRQSHFWPLFLAWSKTAQIQDLISGPKLKIFPQYLPRFWSYIVALESPPWLCNLSGTNIYHKFVQKNPPYMAVLLDLALTFLMVKFYVNLA